ncbi:nuclear transport factor 2 family protein [Actinopolymorpha alba]|uniref:nuclear transport factor 2 family protein n=1 Tax=Actinopolymorpha alba TaxID=533267 RepID=UPI00035C69AA|nr:nuclear transport factor 2 family protein [Actinopolymorpha alba]
MDDQQILDLAHRYAAAELAGDVDAYDDLLHKDFRGIGPVGFVLDRDAWAQRHRGDLTNHEFGIEQPELRPVGDATVLVTAIQRQRTTAMGRDTSGSFRIGMVAVRDGRRWLLAQIQLSGPLVAPGARPGWQREGAQDRAGFTPPGTDS